MIKAIIFDYGGVIKRPHNCLQDILNAYGVTKEKLFEVMFEPLSFLRKGTIGEKEFWEVVSRRLRKAIPHNWEILWRRQYEKGFYLYPEILDFIKELKEKGIKTAVLSNVIQPHVEIIKENSGYKNFDVVVLSCETGVAKPEKDIYLLTIRKLGIKAEECLFVDDKEEWLRPARDLGMETLLAQSPKQVISDIKNILSGEAG